MSKPIVYFGPRREPAVLVEDFRELSAGMVVYDTHCESCARAACRGQLIALHETEGVIEGLCDGYAWELQPPCYSPGEGHFSGVDPGAVAEARIYRVILEPPANTETRETSKPRELEKA